MNCNDCCYNLPKNGHSYCTYEEGECIKISILEKENAELDCQKNRNKFCYSCANATERCYRKEIGCPCGKYKSYKDENAELKEKLKCAEHNCKVKQEFNDNQFNAIMKLKDEFIKLTDELYLSGLSEKQIAIIEQIQDLVEKDKKHHYKAEVINGRPTGKAILVPDNLAYAKSIVKNLLDNSDEYAKQRAREFLEENLK